MDDKMIKALADNGGIIMINFGSGFVSPAAQTWFNAMSSKRKQIEAKHGRESEAYRQFSTQYCNIEPYPFANIDTVLDHIDHVVALVGVDHIGIGSDYDGVGDSLPEGLKDVSTYPNLVHGLLARGYSEENIVKILGANFLRVWREVEDIDDFGAK